MPPPALALPAILYAFPWKMDAEDELGILIGAAITIFALVLYLVVKLRQMTRENWAKVNKVLDPEQVEELMLGNPPLVVDLRDPEDFKGRLGHIRSAMSIPYDQLGARLDELRGTTGNRPIVLVDGTGRYSHYAAQYLAKQGFSWVYVLQGGMKAWVGSKLPVYH